MGWTGYGCKSVWGDLSKWAVTYFCRRLSVGIDELWRTASTCETSARPRTPSPTPYPSTPRPPILSPPPPQFAFLPPNLALTAVHAFSFHHNAKKWERFFTIPAITGHFLFKVPPQLCTFKYDWLMNNQTRNGTSNSSRSLKADLFCLSSSFSRWVKRYWCLIYIGSAFW